MTGYAAGDSTTSWSLVGYRAALAHGELRAVIDAAAPSRGLTQLSMGDAALAGHWLGVDVGADAPPDDAYVRGADFVVVYRENASRPYTVEVYWSAGRGFNHQVILDVTVSIQTRQWEAYPSVAASSQLAGATVRATGPTACVLRPQGVEWSYVEVTAPQDFEGVGCTDQSAMTWRFGDHFMERGVIRRLRLRGAVVARDGDEAAAAELQAALATEAPPLTV